MLIVELFIVIVLQKLIVIELVQFMPQFEFKLIQLMPQLIIVFIVMFFFEQLPIVQQLIIVLPVLEFMQQLELIAKRKLFEFIIEQCVVCA